MITARLVGRLGGGMEQTPLVGGPYAGTVTLHTVTVPAGETWVCAITGAASGDPSYRSYRITFGGKDLSTSSGVHTYRYAVVLAGGTTTTLEKSGSADVTVDLVVHTATLDV
ncbi:hypothetical protein [Tomitella gaofuii]|uniref:hypothetical protein n=1 Tax=Tomitella gaofuii TaxID=2760083 RepID=UPI0015FBC0A5|nr:hypothetical protein [Tomitella gaofuii]